jgi:hypothetical protein
MKKQTFPLLTFLIIVFAAPSAYSQVMLGGQVSYLTGDDQNIWGGGAQVKFMLGGRLAIGATLRSYPKKFNKEVVGSGSTQVTVRSADAITPITGMLEYYFGKNNGIQPYIGIDAGLYFHKVYTEAKNGNTVVLNQSEGTTNFGVAPKIGLMFKTGGLIAPFVQAQYHANFGSGNEDNLTIPGINSPWESKITNSFATFDAGIIIRLKAAGK